MLYVLPDSAGDILVVQATGKLTQEDFQDVLQAQIKKQLKPNLKLRVLLYLDHNLEDIDATSNWCHKKFIQACDAEVIRVAIVADSNWENWSHTFLQHTPIAKHFRVSDFLKALHWLDELNI
jgi:hypothetical protein